MWILSRETGSTGCSSIDDGKLDQADHGLGLDMIDPVGSEEPPGLMLFGRIKLGFFSVISGVLLLEYLGGLNSHLNSRTEIAIFFSTLIPVSSSSTPQGQPKRGPLGPDSLLYEASLCNKNHSISLIDTRFSANPRVSPSIPKLSPRSCG